MKDLLSNVGSGGGAAAAAGGAPAAGGAGAAEEAAEEAKEEGEFPEACPSLDPSVILTITHREGGVRRGYGFRSFRLNGFRDDFFFPLCKSFELCMGCDGSFTTDKTDGGNGSWLQGWSAILMELMKMRSQPWPTHGVYGRDVTKQFSFATKIGELDELLKITFGLVYCDHRSALAAPGKCCHHVGICEVPFVYLEVNQPYLMQTCDYDNPL